MTLAPFVQFELERWMSVWERRIRFNLCESGVHPLTTAELLELSGTDWHEASSIRLSYGAAKGSDELREAIARRYASRADQVLVTTGSAEALFLLCWMLLDRGTNVVIPVPTYFQALGMARNVGATVVPVPYRPERDWELDLDAFRGAVTADTRVVVVANPNNPTGRSLDPEAEELILERAAAVGAWLIVDEMYHGAELDGVRTRSFFGRYDRVIVTSGLSKAHGLPGLRLGWLVGPTDLTSQLWWRHDYTVLAPNPVSDFLACGALANEPRLFARTREILTVNYGTLDRELRGTGLDLSWRRPDGGAICLVRYPGGRQSTELADALRTEHDVLVAPGDHFEGPGTIRVGIGNAPAAYPAAVGALTTGLTELLT